jgi:hypothetical protein
MGADIYLFGEDCGGGPGRSGARHLLDAHHDVPSGCWQPGTRPACIAPGAEAQTANSRFDALGGLADFVISGAGGRWSDSR